MLSKPFVCVSLFCVSIGIAFVNAACSDLPVSIHLSSDIPCFETLNCRTITRSDVTRPRCTGDGIFSTRIVDFTCDRMDARFVTVTNDCSLNRYDYQTRLNTCTRPASEYSVATLTQTLYSYSTISGTVCFETQSNFAIYTVSFYEGTVISITATPHPSTSASRGASGSNSLPKETINANNNAPPQGLDTSIIIIIVFAVIIVILITVIVVFFVVPRMVKRQLLKQQEQVAEPNTNFHPNAYPMQQPLFGNQYAPVPNQPVPPAIIDSDKTAVHNSGLPSPVPIDSNLYLSRPPTHHP